MSMAASIPVANMLTANDLLNNTADTPGKKSFGPNNFSVPAYDGPSPTVALLHTWGDPAFEEAVAALPDVTIQQGTDPASITTLVAETSGATWGQDAKPLVGNVTPGLYRDAENVLWWVLQSYDTAIWPDPLLIPALIRLVKVPGTVEPWQQPLDQYDAYKLINPFTGQPDQCLHNGDQWQVVQADGTGNNIWEPGVFGWEVV